MEPVVKTFIPEIKAVGDRRIAFTISTANLDRHGDTVAVDGWDTDAYMRNPVVLFGHNYDAPPIGRCVSLRKTSNALIATAEFATADLNPMGDSVYKMVKAGFLNATSVGFLPKEYRDTKTGRDFTKQELLEWSVVPVPANSDALAISRSLKALATRAKTRSSSSSLPDTVSYDDALRIMKALDAEYDRRFGARDEYYGEATIKAILARVLV